MNKKIKNHGGYFIKEIIPVIVGILIALYINNWNETRKDKAYLQQISHSIESELNDTHKEIGTFIPIQETLIDSLEQHLENQDMTLVDILVQGGGFQIPQVRINTWNAISSSKIELLNYKKLTYLSAIAELKEYLQTKTDFLLNFLYANTGSQEKSEKETLRIVMFDIIQTEKSIQKAIEAYQEIED